VQTVTYLCRRPVSTMLNERLVAYLRDHPIPPPPPPPAQIPQGKCERDFDCEVGRCYEGMCRR
jgi:hypothetical protein